MNFEDPTPNRDKENVPEPSQPDPSPTDVIEQRRMRRVNLKGKIKPIFKEHDNPMYNFYPTKRTSISDNF